MNHVMRRRDRALSEAEALEILDRSDYGILATAGADGWPYATPVNHVRLGDSLYIHCAREGHKLENIAQEARVSYCAVSQAEVMPEKLSTRYASAVVFGTATLVQEAGEKSCRPWRSALPRSGRTWLPISRKACRKRPSCASALNGSQARRGAERSSAHQPQVALPGRFSEKDHAGSGQGQGTTEGE